MVKDKMEVHYLGRHTHTGKSTKGIVHWKCSLHSVLC